MGCRVSHEPETTTNEMSHSDDEIDYKSRLEKKICLAKETPEPEYEISGCNLKEVPPGVFVVCRVLRKENLILCKNKLQSLTNGGSLNDLNLISFLDLRCNKFKKLPDDIYKLENLREFLLSENHLENLPKTINRLNNLEHLDISQNRLTNIEQISCMPRLRILNIKGNPKLIKLPNELSTCESLVDIVLDTEIIQYPSPDITNLGTLNILRFLATGEINLEKQTTIKEITKQLISSEKESNFSLRDDEKNRREKLLLEMERLALEKDYNLEAKLHNEQQKRKEILLQQIRFQEKETETNLNQIQKERQFERDRLINDLLKAEEDSSLIVDRLIILKNGPDPALIEREMIEQETLLEQLRIQESDLRKKEILAAMTDVLKDEMDQIQIYQQQRDNESKNILEQESASNTILENIFINYDKNRIILVDKINQNEELQKTAFAALISKNDARSWGLCEQLRIVESQLAAMTYYEIERKKLSMDEQLSELSVRRLDLTFILLDLLDQQEKRKQQLFETLRSMEDQKQSESENFWLLQYQRLIDSQPSKFIKHNSSIDPLLGYNFLVNGVVHCLPFLSNLWLDEHKDLQKITESDLLEAGVKKEKDRFGILKSIESFLRDADSDLSIDEEAIEAIEQPSTSSDKVIAQINTSSMAECVVCMENDVNVIFLPCGHLCCCNNCQVSLTDCPMCRSTIERRIRVIQPGLKIRKKFTKLRPKF